MYLLYSKVTMGRLTNFLSAVLLSLILLCFGPALIKSIKTQYNAFFTSKTKIARISLHSGATETDSIYDAIESAFKNPQIKAVLLRIEGTTFGAGSTQAIHDEIIELKRTYKKPVVSFTYDQCVDDAYSIACATDMIVTSPAAIVGGIKPETCRTVAICRALPLSGADTWAHEQTFSGADALKIKLVDAVGTFSTAVKKIKELAIIEREIEWVTVQEPARKTLWPFALACVQLDPRL